MAAKLSWRDGMEKAELEEKSWGEIMDLLDNEQDGVEPFCYNDPWASERCNQEGEVERVEEGMEEKENVVSIGAKKELVVWMEDEEEKENVVSIEPKKEFVVWVEEEEKENVVSIKAEKELVVWIEEEEKENVVSIKAEKEFVVWVEEEEKENVVKIEAEEKESVARIEEKENVPWVIEDMEQENVERIQETDEEKEDVESVEEGREESRVDVIFPGIVTSGSCYSFVCELLKYILYQRQQLPMTYHDMVVFEEQQLASTQMDEEVFRKPMMPSEYSSWQRCERTLRDLEEVFEQLEELFSLSLVPRVLFMLGSSEVYEINMECLVEKYSDRSLNTSQCLRQLFHTFFQEDFLSDAKPARLVGTTVLALAHRDCGVDWFKPKVDFRIPTRVKRRVIVLASAGNHQRKVDSVDLENYIWFQTPVAIKGFRK